MRQWMPVILGSFSVVTMLGTSVSAEIAIDPILPGKDDVRPAITVDGAPEPRWTAGSKASSTSRGLCDWQPGFTVSDLDNYPYAMEVFNDGSGPALYVGGIFGAANGTVVNNIARWDGSTWSALVGPTGTGIDGSVHALAVYDDGSGPALYVGGDFNTAGGVTVNGIARWRDGVWSALSGSSGTGVGGGYPYVLALTVYDDGSGPALYAGGYFATAGGVTVNGVARWRDDDWSALAGPSGTGVAGGSNPHVEAVSVYDDGAGPALYAGGYFETAGGVTANHIARWDGSSWSALAGPSEIGVGGSSYSPVAALTVFDDGSGPALFAGGRFTTAGGLTVNRIARWDGSAWSPLSGPSGTGVNTNSVSSLAVHDDGSGLALYAGGYFWEAGGVPVNNIARWNGSAWSALSSTGLGAPSTLASFDDGSGPALFVGAGFTTAGGDRVNNIARWDGNAWSALNQPSGQGVNGSIAVLGSYGDSNLTALIAGGYFDFAGNVSAKRIGSWDGSSWTSLNGGFPLVVGEHVHALAPFDSGSGSELVVGGYFPYAGSSYVSVNHIARWDGSAWSPLSGPSGTGVDGTGRVVSALAEFDDGSGPSLFAAGSFETAGGVTVNKIARWDGSAWSALSGPSGTGIGGTNPSVSALAVYDDGSGPALYAGGIFTTAGGVAVNNIARWDGTAWSPLDGPSGTGTNYYVRALAVFDDGTGPALYAGGSFSSAGGVAVNYISRWDGSSWSALSGPSGIGVGGAVYALTAFDDGLGPALYVGGSFRTAGGVIVNNVARWDGSAWSGLGGPTGLGTNSGLSAFAAIDEGSSRTLYVGGGFTVAGGLASSRIAAWRCIPDTIPPSDPTILSSPTHNPGVWSPADVIGVQWSGAADSGGSDLDGYSVLFDAEPSTVPDENPDVPHTVDPHVDTSGTLADGSSHFFHLRTCDRAGNCSVGLHLGPFWIDATAPGTVSDLFSPSHTVGTPTADATVDLTWTAAADATSGVAGYGVGVTASPSWSCDQVQATTTTSYSSAPLADGAWYAHVCAVDEAGNWGAVASVGPFVIDGTPPTVAFVQSVAGTGDGRLEDTEVTRASITQLYVRFAETVYDPAGDSDPDDVTNPDNYVLVGAGADGLFSTASCAGGVFGDDQPVAVEGVLYDGQEITARVRLADGMQLPRGWYRLLVCGSTSILDLAGNALDGDGNGIGGDDLQLDFAISDTNLLVNPNLDDDLAAWLESSVAEVIWGPDDADQAPTSGSVAMTYIGDDQHLVSISQCVAVRDAQGHSVGGRTRVPSGVVLVPLVAAMVDLYDAPGCGGTLLGSRWTSGVQGETGTEWRGFWGWLPAIPNQQSAVVTLVLDPGGLPDLTADLDDLFFTEMLFGDGFDWGDVSGWSMAVR